MTKEVTHAPVWTWSFAPQEAGTKLTVSFREENVPLWQRTIEKTSEKRWSKQIDGWLAGIKTGAEEASAARCALAVMASRSGPVPWPTQYDEETSRADGDRMWWMLWLAAAGLLGVAEFFTLTLVAGLLAGAALVAAVTAGLGAALPIQLAAFAVSAGVGLVAVRPIAKRHLALPPVTREGSYALVGRSALVMQQVSATGGLVHLAGEDWSARSYVEDQVIPPGVRVDVFEIDGATALVHPSEPLPEPLPGEG